MFEYIWILLPLGLLIGWFAAKRDFIRKQRFLHYLNLRYVLEDEAKKNTKDALMDIPLNGEEEEVKFSLTLGDAFRRRGEIEKAINLHEYVFKNEEVDRSNRAHALHSLSEDYMMAGLLDRAESTLRQLIDYSEYKEIALRQLVYLYKQQRDWLQAIAVLERIETVTDTKSIEIAHLYCELAEGDLDDYAKSFSWAEQALSYDTNCARANLIKAYLAYEKGDYQKAFDYLQYIEFQQHSLVPLVVPVMYRISSFLGAQIFNQWLDKQLTHDTPHFHLYLWKTHLLVMNVSIQDGIEYLGKKIAKEHNLQGVLLLNQLLAVSNDNEFYLLYGTVFNNIIDQYAQFRCEKCGFISKTLQWSCPSCHSWNTDTPVSDIIALQKLI